MATLRSDGEDQLSAYVESEVPPSRPEPAVEVERVAFVDPRRTPTVRLNDGRKGSGPRNPEQTALPGDDEPRIELPDGLPLTAPQQVYVPPELAAKWREEAKKGTS
jgi:hypothetical protein